MMISELQLGKVDGKAEFSDAKVKNGVDFSASYLVPENVRLTDFDDAERYFIQGFRGTGKTSLLRFYTSRNQPNPKFRKLVLFKSHFDESYRLELSKGIGFEWAEADPKKMEISQDFKVAWSWFVLHKLAELVKDSPEISNGNSDLFLDLCGLRGKTFVDKVLGILPKLEGANVKVSGDLGLLSGELSADFISQTESEGRLPLRALVEAQKRAVKKLSFSKRVVVGFDELEAFYTDEETYKRDLRMVRDLLFVIDSLNQFFLENEIDVFLMGAVRSEVLSAMKADGQEIDRTVHDHGVTLSWHHSNRSIKHPLLEIVRKKLEASGVESEENEDVFFKVFPKEVSGMSIDRYLLDGSFYKPRDIVWRLSLIQEQYRTATVFSARHFQQTENSYSQKLWSEIEYELSATYSNEDILVIKMLFSGYRKYFSIDDFLKRLHEKSGMLGKHSKFLDPKKGAHELLHNLYRLGAVGNDYALDSRGKRRANRWVFRNEPDLLIDRQMSMNDALAKALSTRRPERRR